MLQVFFTAITLIQQKPKIKIAILERGATCLEKVRISGGGRCNVTHADFLPRTLISNYPRGHRELLGPFHQFMTGDTMSWFEERGVPLKVEGDGRIFPISDSSQTIIDCFLDAAKEYNVEIKLKESVQDLVKTENKWMVKTKNAQYVALNIVIATGNNTKIWNLLANRGHHIISPVPSLFTFNCGDARIADLQGISTNVCLSLMHDKTGLFIKDASGKRIDQEGISGPLLITHWGFSGPGILRLSAIAARELNAANYDFRLRVNWLIDKTVDEVIDMFKNLRHTRGKQNIIGSNPFDLPKRLWQNIVLPFALSEKQTWAEISKGQMKKLALGLTQCDFRINGKKHL